MDPATATDAAALAASSGDSGAVFGTVVAVLVFYFLPSMIALARKHHNRMQIILLNLLLGWTFLGWIGALIWSAGTVKRPGTA